MSMGSGRFAISANSCGSLLNAKRAVLASKSKRPPPSAGVQPPANKKCADIRLKKGMKTAKQRLGKILKLHKMIY
ncbi:hypothetical protein RR48_04030 [Papilio machaon]|uniref:Uncharacterized protein n=1 Tax=Papilio machaon TaxID=76193 RepID=A0A0N1IBH2_PAPMA|nr:hypothetical protein RR48_04030 [Papilio machaon]